MDELSTRLSGLRQQTPQQLWKRLREFPFDDPHAELKFSKRLARENGWSEEFAARVVEEYRRFLFLCVVSGHEVCPSDEVDQAWHLHLTYTRSYWEGLCRDTLGQAVHHGPTKGGPAEHRKHVAMYVRTLAAYEENFGLPPPDIWPDVAQRFTGNTQQRINRASCWIIRKPRWFVRVNRPLPPRCRLAQAGVAAMPLVLAVAGPWNWKGPVFLELYLLLLISVVLFHIVWRYMLSMTFDADDESEVNYCEAACLAFNRRVAVNAAVAKLTHEGKLAVTKQTERSHGAVTDVEVMFVSQGEIEPEALPLERAVHAIAEDGGTLSQLQESAATEAGKVRDRLQQRGLLVSDHRARWIRWAPGAMMAGLLVFGLVKIVIGMTRERPVSYLVVLSIIAMVLFFVVIRRPHRTTAGTRLVRRLKREHGNLPATMLRSSTTSQEVALAAGLFGAAVLAEGPIADVYQAWQNTTLTGKAQWHSGSGCGTGCGAGCGGGGCGGGGCGGGCGGCG